jgi:hypothetical protein
MKASELIEKLQKVIELYGDLQVSLSHRPKLGLKNEPEIKVITYTNPKSAKEIYICG